MSILKSQIKIDMAKGLVEQTGSLAQGCLDELYRHEGEKRALTKASTSLDLIFKRVDNLPEESLTGLSPLEVVALIKRSLTEVHQSLVDLVGQSDMMKVHTTGRLDAYKRSSEIIRRVAETESEKLRVVQGMGEGQDIPEDLPLSQQSIPVSRPSGVRPPESLASRRKAEVKKKPNTRVLKSGGTSAKSK
jgi:hypothetical protein